MLFANLERAIKKAPEEVWDLVTDVLDDVLEGRTTLEAVRHPLGFICLPIVRDDTPEGVCLHYWSDQGRSHERTTSKYHCHSWSLLSHVLAGSIGNQRLDLFPGDKYRLFHAVSNGPVDSLIPTGSLVDVSCAEPEFYFAGESYELAAGEFHASVAGAAPVSVTLVLGRMIPGAADITLGEVDTGEHRVTRVAAGCGYARSVAREILRLRPAR
jgi:hypothetical protein